MEFTTVATGFCLIEAPIWDERGLWFTDILLGGVRCLRPDGTIGSWLTERKIIGGIALNRDGRLICSGTGGIVWLDPDSGETGTLIDAIDGVPISGVNDVLADGRGGLYFGTVDHRSMLAGQEFFGASQLARLDPDGRVTILLDGVGFSNGIGIAPGGKRLLFNDSPVGTYEIELLANGEAGEAALLLDEPGVDGLTVDEEGAVWAASMAAGDIVRVLPGGQVDRRIPVPGGHVVSLCFGGPDNRDLYVTTAADHAGEAAIKRVPLESVQRSAVVHRVRADVAGAPVGKTAFALGAE